MTPRGSTAVTGPELMTALNPPSRAREPDADGRRRKEHRPGLEREVARRRQPRIRAGARRTAATSAGIVIGTRARFGYPAAPGSTVDAGLRHLTLTLSSQHATRLFEAQEAGATEDRLREPWARSTSATAAAAPTASRWQFTDLEHVEFDL